MGTLSEAEKQGLRDFFQQLDDVEILVHIARSVTKNLTDVYSQEEALNILFLHSPSVMSILSKRILTKELLFKYLHRKRIPVSENFTKTGLISKIHSVWNSKPTEQITNNIATISPKAIVERTPAESKFHIHLLARQFAQWFFERMNENSIDSNDFWCDANIKLYVIATDGNSVYNGSSANDVVMTLCNVKDQFNFHFNPNVTHEGVQGRINAHGLVLVLSCGTLHTQDKCVGIFESTFGLMKDPFSSNNWKVKTVHLLLRSTDATTTHCLQNSESLNNHLELPAPADFS